MADQSLLKMPLNRSSSSVHWRFMSYQVIARKYRPQRFSEVVGQEHVTQTLANAIQQNRIAHAYLFVGPRGTGKTTVARIFAKCLNCTGGPSVDFTDDDPKAREITEGRSMDVLEIDGASNRGIEEIRELRETVKYAPAGSKFKIYIIDEVHMLTKEAFNALLKTLEEPPSHVKFMFATTEPEKVLPTILSRCQRFDLRRIPAGLIVKHLGDIAAREGVEIDDAALYAIARGAEGGMRDAESTLDQLISFCGSRIQEADVLSMFGLAARAQLLSLAAAILAGDQSGALRELNELARNGKDLSRLLSDLLGHFRNLMIYQFSKGDLSLMDVSEGEAAALAAEASQISSESITRVMEVLVDAEGRLRDAASKKIFLEITLLKAIEARNAVSIDSVLKKLNDLRDGGNGGGGTASLIPAGGISASSNISASPASPSRTAAPVPRQRTAPTVMRETAPPVSAPIPATQPIASEPERVDAPVETLEVSSTPPVPATSPSAGPNEGPDLESVWAEMVEAVGRVSSFMRSYLLQSHPVALSKTHFTIGFDPVFRDQISLVDNPKNRTVLETKLREMGRDVSVRFIEVAAPPGRARPVQQAAAPDLGGSARSTTASPSAARAPEAGKPRTDGAGAPPAGPVFSKDDFKNDPLIKKALEVFKGTIVEVRA
jgi:DNA polymerase-3 subunit gamma/tau